jgi:hypothetical protein
MYHFFKENLGFCNTKGCFDEKTNAGVHYSLGWDPRYNRLLVTKQDGDECNSFTASYTPMGIPTQGGGSRGIWVSLHDYKPQDYLWDRNEFYSIKSGTGELWRHHKKGSYQNFYGKSHPFEVWFTAVSPDLEEFDFEYLVLNTEAEENTVEGYPTKGVDKTFNKIAMWNSTQGTGTLPIDIISDNQGKRKSQYDLITSNYSEVRFHRNGRMWIANAFKDLVVEPCSDMQFLVSDCECQAIPDINEQIFDCSVIKKQDFVNRRIADAYLNIRYTLDNTNDLRLYLKTHKVLDNKKQIPE